MSRNLKIYCQKENLKLVRDFVQEVLEEMQLNEVDANQIVLAVDEICANMIIHSHQCNAADMIEVQINREEQDVTFEIFDYNAPYFDWSAYRKPTINSLAHERRKGGMGLMLVESIMDEIEVAYQGNTNIWKLKKKSNRVPVR